ncbi:MAG TPA: zinc-binding dehydrogenase [Longimicrobiales bacterium]|nr:zinc-binding dehydrogenase [Longimicrobiales bacterium]
MRAWLLRRTGAPSVLRLTEAPDPAPAAGQVSVRVEAIGINYAEVLSRKGLYGWAPKRPYIPGMEAVGVVEALGPGATRRRIGERVICGMQYGAYAESVVVDEARALPALEGFSLEENAAYAVNFMTAWVGLVEMARLRATDRVGITAAAGGVGTAAVQIAASHGCDVLAMASTESKLDRVRPLGATGTVAYGGPDFVDLLAEATAGRGLDVVLETVGGEVYRACLSRLAPFGRLVVAGYAGLDYSIWNPLSWWRAWRGAPRVDVMKAAMASTGVMATHIGYLLPDEDRLLRVWTELTDFTRAHGLRPVVGRTFGFDELPEAHELMESRQSVGKLVVLTDSAR